MAVLYGDMTQIERLNVTLRTLKESQEDHDDMDFSEAIEKVRELLSREKKRLGWMAVYTIVNGCSQECLFEGTPDQCQTYVEIYLSGHPEMKDNIIVLDDYW